MDYGISSGISCFGKDYSRATCSLPPCKYDSVSSVPPNSLLFSGSHFAPQRTASCQDVWGCHVNTQLCMLTPRASRVEVCTVKRGNCTVGWMYGVSSGNHESPFRSPRCFRGKKLITAAAFMFTLFLRKVNDLCKILILFNIVLENRSCGGTQFSCDFGFMRCRTS